MKILLKLVSVVVVMGLVGAESSDSPTTIPALKSTAVPSSSSTDQLPSSTTSAASTSSTTTTTSTTVSAATQSNVTTTTAPTAPTTAPTAPTTATPPPSSSTTPKPKPKEYFWNVTEDGVTCILAKADIKLSLNYKNESSKEEIKIDVPNDASSSGQCGNASQILKLTFGDNSISFNFTRNEDKYHISQIMSTITVGNGDDKKQLSLASGDLILYDTHLSTSYVCSWSEPATLHEDDAQHNVTNASMRVTLNKMRFEAFRNSTEDAFSKEYSCPMDSPDIVPVMVGIALGILVAVVLIAYLVGRRSTQAQGYLSM